MWLKDRLKEKSTYAGLATIGLSLVKEIIPIPFAGEIIEIAAGLILVGINEHKKKR